MAGELTANDLEQYTNGRLVASDPNTVNVLAAALQEVRNYCKWHVSPIITEENQNLDGPGQWGGWGVGVGGLYYSSSYSLVAGRLNPVRVGNDVLYLKTKKLRSIEQITEDGVALDMTTIQWSDGGQVLKTTHQPWTSNYAGSIAGISSGINITYTHGYSEGEAADWRRIVLACADRMSMVKGLVGPFNAMVGPYRLSAYYGTSRPGTLPINASWLDDLFGQIATKRYVLMEI
jgi:hypothetical protein